MIIVSCEQGSPEWDEIKRGVPSSSNFKSVITTKGDPSKSVIKYYNRLVDEIISGESTKGYKTALMQKGNDREPEICEAYELIKSVSVKRTPEIGFCFYDEKREFGSSPDGLVGEDGGFEAKNAEPHIQIERLENGWIGTEYYQQVMGNLLVTKRKWWDLMSYCRNLPPLIIRFDRNEEYIKKLHTEVIMLVNKLNKVKLKYELE